MPRTPADMVAAITRTIREKTGRTVEEWRAVLKKDGPPGTPREKSAWLKTTHQLGHVQAHVVAGVLDQYEQPDKLVDAQYAGARAALRPIYEAVVKAARKAGKGVTTAPCKTYVPLHRTKTFALVKAAANRVDLGLALPGEKPTKRLKTTDRLGSDRITHKIELSSVKEVDAEVARWLARACEISG